MKTKTSMLRAGSMLIALTFGIMPALLAQVRPGETDAAVTSPAPFPDEAASWYSSPWIWLGAALVFILLLIALGRGGKTGKANSAASQTGEIRTEKDPDAA